MPDKPYQCILSHCHEHIKIESRPKSLFFFLPRWICNKLPAFMPIFLFWEKKKGMKKKRVTSAQKKSWKERESACKCSNYSSSDAPVMGIPISFNTSLLSQLISLAWILILELNPSRATYSLSRLTRGLSVVTGRVGRIVLISLHEKKKKRALAKLFRNAPRPWFVFIFLLSSKKKKNGLEAASSTAHSFALFKYDELPVPMAFCACIFFLSRAKFYAVRS